MAKYIDADKMLEEYKHSIYDTTDLAEMLNYMPAADVVEVVRCKDCKYRELTQPQMVYCPNTVCGWVDEDWFCAGGEKE